MELDELYPMTSWPSRSRSPFEVKVTSKEKFLEGFWPPWGNPIPTKFGGHIGNDPRYGNAKGCKNRSKGSQWGWGQSFWGTPTVDQLHPIPINFFSRRGTHICPRHFYNPTWSPICAFHVTFGDTTPRRPPISGFFALLSKFGAKWRHSRCRYASVLYIIGKNVKNRTKRHQHNF